ncbi:hypothetical protein DLREEDagrD3_06310 [Denitratisoma sp. agr-D3]
MIALPLLAGCDQLGIETPAKTLSRQEAEGKAIGSACRHAGRALEDCFTRAAKDKKNKYITKASIFDGWKEMDAYMRENNLAVVPPGAEPEPQSMPAAVEGENGENPAAKEDAPPAPGEKPGTNGAKPDPKKPETKVDTPVDIKPKTGGKISARLHLPTYA